MENLQKLKEIYLTDVDAQSYQENLERITEWEKALIAHENMASWQAHQTTIDIKKQAKESYVFFCVQLATNRKLTDEQRISIYAKQDACLWIMTLGNDHALEDIRAIQRDIQIALQAV